jgi:transcriptional regulator with XRE-family HTH domain
VPLSLGATIRKRREGRSLSTIQAAQQSGISTAYLSKLERGQVAEPSPHILHRLSGVLEIPYEELMILAGYLVPADPTSRESEHTAALFGEELTDDERELLMDYLAWYRERQRRERNGRAGEPARD